MLLTDYFPCFLFFFIFLFYRSTTVLLGEQLLHSTRLAGVLASCPPGRIAGPCIKLIWFWLGLKCFFQLQSFLFNSENFYNCFLLSNMVHEYIFLADLFLLGFQKWTFFKNMTLIFVIQTAQGTFQVT